MVETVGDDSDALLGPREVRGNKISVRASCIPELFELPISLDDPFSVSETKVKYRRMAQKKGTRQTADCLRPSRMPNYRDTL